MAPEHRVLLGHAVPVHHSSPCCLHATPTPMPGPSVRPDTVCHKIFCPGRGPVQSATMKYRGLAGWLPGINVMWCKSCLSTAERASYMGRGHGVRQGSMDGRFASSFSSGHDMGQSAVEDEYFSSRALPVPGFSCRSGMFHIVPQYPKKVFESLLLKHGFSTWDQMVCILMYLIPFLAPSWVDCIYVPNRSLGGRCHAWKAWTCLFGYTPLDLPSDRP